MLVSSTCIFSRTCLKQHGTIKLEVERPSKIAQSIERCMLHISSLGHLRKDYQANYNQIYQIDIGLKVKEILD